MLTRSTAVAMGISMNINITEWKINLRCQILSSHQWMYQSLIPLLLSFSLICVTAVHIRHMMADSELIHYALS